MSYHVCCFRLGITSFVSVVITSIVIARVRRCSRGWSRTVSIEIATCSTMAWGSQSHVIRWVTNSVLGGSAFNSVIKMVYTPLIMLVCIISVATIGSPTIKVPVGFTDFAGWTGWSICHILGRKDRIFVLLSFCFALKISLLNFVIIFYNYFYPYHHYSPFHLSIS